MRVIGREVELVGVPFADLERAHVPEFRLCATIFRHHCYYSAEKLIADVPEFRPRVSLQASLTQVLEAMDREGRVTDSDAETWEDDLIAAQRSVGDTLSRGCGDGTA